MPSPNIRPYPIDKAMTCKLGQIYFLQKAFPR